MRAKTKLVKGDAIELLICDESWHKGKVRDALSSQFTTTINRKVRFFFYADEGVTWRRARVKASV